jgi:hypothetical protein
MNRSDSYIFYLNLNARLDPQYIGLAKALSLLEITVIPVNAKELINFLKRSSLSLIVLNPDCQTNITLQGNIGKILELAVKSGKINLFEFSSFKSVLSTLPQSMRKRHFHSYLPINYQEAVLKIINSLYNGEERTQLTERIYSNFKKDGPGEHAE